MVPALMVMLLTMLCGFLPALNIVGEKEAGTIEQINVTPVGKFTFILAKLIPYWLIGFCCPDSLLCFGMDTLWYLSCGAFWGHLLFLHYICPGCIRPRAGHFQPFGYDAASYVCHVVLYVDPDSDERAVYPYS